MCLFFFTRSAVELVDNVENQPWFRHSSQRAQKLQLKKIKDSIRAITRSKAVSSAKLKSGRESTSFRFMSEKEASRIRRPKVKMSSKFKKTDSNGFLMENTSKFDLKWEFLYGPQIWPYLETGEGISFC